MRAKRKFDATDDFESRAFCAEMRKMFLTFTHEKYKRLSVIHTGNTGVDKRHSDTKRKNYEKH